MHPAFEVPRDSLGTECPDETVPAGSTDVCGTATREPVGATLQLSDAELDRHIAELTWLWSNAYDHWLESGNPHDREAVERLRHEREQAVQTRLRRIEDHGVGYFSSDAALALGADGGRSRA